MINGSHHELPRRLSRILARRVLEHAERVRAPMPYEQLLLWIRLQWPQVLPEAVGKSLCDLAAIGFLESDELGWRIRPEASRPRAARAHRSDWNPPQARP